MPLNTACDLELSPGQFCDKPVTYLALSADTPELWRDDENSTASLAVFCSREHALAEPRPDLAAAKHSQALIADMTNEQVVLDAWARALAAYPEPVTLKEIN